MMVSEPPYHNQPPWDVDGRSELDAEIERLRAENAKLHVIIKDLQSWLRRNANAEKEPKARAAFIEAHNAVAEISRALTKKE